MTIRGSGMASGMARHMSGREQCKQGRGALQAGRNSGKDVAHFMQGEIQEIRYGFGKEGFGQGASQHGFRQEAIQELHFRTSQERGDRGKGI
eukprot:gene5003-biopygen15308